MAEELVVREDFRPLTAADVRAQVNLIQEVMAGVMKSGEHYGVIPGCGGKPTLLKPGAEKLASTFRMAPDPEVIELSTGDSIKYRVICRMLSQTTGAFLGAGVGTCSSDEEKYKWRKALCDEEWDDTPEDRRRKKWKRGNNVTYQERQVRTNPADLDNTVLKMSKKRSMVDAVLTITGASDIFAQDLEDLPREVIEKDKAQPEPPKSKPQPEETPKPKAQGKPKAKDTRPEYTAFFKELYKGTKPGTPERTDRNQLCKHYAETNKLLADVREWTTEQLRLAKLYVLSLNLGKQEEPMEDATGKPDQPWE